MVEAIEVDPVGLSNRLAAKDPVAIRRGRRPPRAPPKGPQATRLQIVLDNGH
jgi:hypothetical protein